MALTQTYVDPSIAGDSGTGTVGDPYGDLQYALNTMTGDATNGDQINVKAGTAEVLAASLSLATYGTPTAGAPLLLRGYTTAANDGGMAEIDCNGATMWTSAYDHVNLADMEVYNGGNNNLIALGDYCLVYHCEAHKGASSPSNKKAIVMDDYSRVMASYIHDYSWIGIEVGQGGAALWNYIADMVYSGDHGVAVNLGVSGGGNAVLGNLCLNATIAVANGTDYSDVIGNVVYSGTASARTGISLGLSTAGYGRIVATVLNNIVVGFSGVGGVGIANPLAEYNRVIGYNAFYNNTANYSLTRDPLISLVSSDVALAADPFTSAATGDFSLTEAAKTALRSLGWPASYLGAHANSDPHITIGPMQYGPTPSGSSVYRRVARLLGG